MLSDKKIALSFVFQRKGQRKLKISDIVLYLSVSLGWFDISTARLFVEQAIKEGLLRKIDDFFVEPTFDYENIKTPVGFRPKPEDVMIAENKKKRIEEKDYLLERICREISNGTGEERQKILDDVKKISADLGVYPEIAALLICKKKGIEINRFVDDVEKGIILKKS